ncbi:MAG TPA: hypothetical protein VH184_15965 [Dongiaceae bacterium]|nr:hypothetical protein [Dongiaceae bacterium]
MTSSHRHGCDTTQKSLPLFRRSAAHVSAVSRRHELLILCARIGFNP